MALNKKGGFGLDLEKQFENVGSVGDVKPAEAYTHTDAYTDKKENKTLKIYPLVRPTPYGKLVAYAKATNDTPNNIINELIEKFVQEKGL